VRHDGSYATSLVAGGYRVRVFGRSVTSGERLEVPRGAASLDATVVVAAVGAAETITGSVVDERERPLADVTVYSLGSETSWALTDSRGDFALHRPAGDRSHDTELCVWHEGFAPCRSEARVRWGSRDRRLTLRTGLSVEVRVTAAEDGEPIEDFALKVRRQPGNPAQYLGDDAVPYEAPDHHEGGVARVSGLAPGEHVLDVVPVRADLAPSLLVPVAFTAAGPRRIDVALRPGAIRLLRVESAGGAAAPGTDVELIDPRGGQVTTTSSAGSIADQDADASRALRLLRGTTDVRGELQLHGARGRRFVLRLSGKGHPPLVVPDVALDADGPLVVTLRRGARLEGVLGPAEVVRGLRAACGDGAGAATQPVREPPGFRLLRGDEARRETFPPAREPAARVAPDGTFVIDAAPAGAWQLALEPWSFDRPGRRGPAQPVAAVELRDGETTKAAVDLPDWLPALVEGQALWNGAVMADRVATLLTRHRDSSGVLRERREQVRTDRDGRFSARTRAGSAILTVTGSRERVWHTLWSTQPVAVAPGTVTTASFAIDSGVMRLRLVGGDGKPVAGVPLVLLCEGELESAWPRARTAPSDAEGWVECEGETRELTVQALPRRLASDEAQRMLLERTPEGSADPTRAHRVTLGRVVPRRGETVSVDLHLPAEWYR
jgi:hypothetical protein